MTRNFHGSTFFIVFVFVIYSCKSDNDYLHVFENKVEFNLDRKVKFPLDSLTSSSKRSIKYLMSDEGKEFLYSLNQNINAIEIFDIEFQKWVRRIRLPVQGPNGVGALSYILPINKDSLITLSSAQQLSIITSQGKVLDRFGPFFNRETGEGAYVLALGEVSPIYRQGKVYFFTTAGYDTYIDESTSNNLSNEKNLMILDLKSRKVEYRMKFPETYLNSNGLWGDHYYAVKYHDFNPTTGDFVLSLPADQNVYVTDYNEQYKPVYAGSEHFDQIAPFYKWKNLSRLSSEDEAKDFALNPSYQNIKYDRFRDVFYRVVELPYTEEELETSSDAFIGIKRWSLVTLDSNFTKIGEKKMPENLLAGSFLIIKEGLLIYDYIENKNDEDNLNYSLFEVKIK